jgi:hypothetical protein
MIMMRHKFLTMLFSLVHTSHTYDVCGECHIHEVISCQSLCEYDGLQHDFAQVCAVYPNVGMRHARIFATLLVRAYIFTSTILKHLCMHVRAHTCMCASDTNLHLSRSHTGRSRCGLSCCITSHGLVSVEGPWAQRIHTRTRKATTEGEESIGKTQPRLDILFGGSFMCAH